MNPQELARELREARDSLNDAIATAVKGDLFAAGSHYRAALIKLEEIGES